MTEPLTREGIVEALRKEMPYLRERYGVEAIAIYGSFAKGTQHQASDVDVLVQLAKPLGLEFVSLALYLEELLGRKVDLATFESLRRSMETHRRREMAEDILQTLSYV